MDKVTIKSILVILCVLIVLNVLEVKYFENLLQSGSYLKHAHITYYTSPDTKWDDLPPFLKEQISKNSTSKLNLKDLQQLEVYYHNLIINYKEPVCLAEEKK